MAATAASLCLIAAIGRTGRADLSAPGYSPWDETVIDSYFEPVTSFYAYRASHETSDLLHARDVWLGTGESGSLNDIPIAHLEDQGHAGVKGEILHAKLNLSLSLSNLARNRAIQGDVDTAANLYLDAFEIADIGKFSGFSASLDSVREQERILILSRPVISEASPAVKSRAVAVLADLRQLENHVDDLTVQIQEVYEKEQSLRTGETRSRWEIGFLYDGIASKRSASASTGVDTLGLLNDLDERLHRAYVFGVATASAEDRLLEMIASFAEELTQVSEQV
jgi:hypothetical protein